jgi:hypothetical protein
MALSLFNTANIATLAVLFGVCSSALAQRQIESPLRPAAAPEFKRESPIKEQPAPRDIRRPPTPLLLITTATALPPASRGKPYSHTLTLSGGKGPYQWSVIGGRLPAGLTMSSAGVLSGTPNASGSFSFMVRATDSTVGKPRTTARNFTLTVAAPPGALVQFKPITITTQKMSIVGGSLLARGAAFTPKTITTQKMSIVGGSLLARGAAFTPVTVTTQSMTITGN